MAAILFTALIALLAVFQLAIVAGAPLGEYAWGGQHTGRLPVHLRVGSAVSLIVYLGFALAALDRSGMIALFPEPFSRIAIWVVFGILALGTLMNLISRSRKERLIMTPVAAILAILALVIALS